MNNILAYGSSIPLPEKRLLKAGNIIALYEQGNLRYIKSGDKELVRMIYSAVRDHNWGTLDCIISDETVVQNENSFSVSYVASYGFPAVFKATYNIEGSVNGCIRFSMQGKMVKDFYRNRIGFCVLHPIKECAGKKVNIIHSNNSAELFEFPFYISPHQPFKDIKGMKWNVDGCECTLDFEGDIFETEDQRNWTDASFKTYCTPLEKTFPVLMKKGDEIKQSVILTVLESSIDTQKADNIFSIRSGDKLPIPKIGTIYPSLNRRLNNHELECITKIGLNHFRVDVNFSRADWRLFLRNAIADAVVCNIGLEICLHLSTDYIHEINQFIHETVSFSKHIYYLSILTKGAKSTIEEHLINAVELLKNKFPNALIGAGTDYDFTDLNRYPIIADALDYVFYSVCPQVHAFDNLSMIENIVAQSDTVLTAKKQYLFKKIFLSAISLRRRSNPDATGEDKVNLLILPKDIDPRQMSLFAAGWTLGALSTAIKNEVKLVTFYEAIGFKGLFMGNINNIYSDKFFAQSGDKFPIYHLLKIIHSFNPNSAVCLEYFDPLTLTAVVFKKELKSMLLLANHSNFKIDLIPEKFTLTGNINIAFISDIVLNNSVNFKIINSQNYVSLNAFDILICNMNG